MKKNLKKKTLIKLYCVSSRSIFVYQRNSFVLQTLNSLLSTHEHIYFRYKQGHSDIPREGIDEYISRYWLHNYIFNNALLFFDYIHAIQHYNTCNKLPSTSCIELFRGCSEMGAYGWGAGN